MVAIRRFMPVSGAFGRRFEQPSQQTLDDFVRLDEAERSAALQTAGGVAYGRACLALALDLDFAEGADAVRHAMQGLPGMSAKTARRVGHAVCDTSIARKAWRRGSYAIASRDPEAGERLAGRGKISAACFLQGFADADAARAHAERLIAGGRLNRDGFLHQMGAPPHIALDWTLDGSIGVSAFFAHVPEPPPAAMAALVKAGLVPAHTWLALGNMPADEIFARVEAGTWSPYRCIDGGWVPDACVRAWIEAGSIAPRTYLHASLRHWRPSMPLAPAWIDFAASYPSMEALVDTLGRINPGLAADNFALFARRMLAAHVQGVRAYAQVVPAAKTSRPERCAACYDDVTDSTDLCKPGACVHAPAFCRDCMEKSAAEQVRCPYPDCETALTPDDMLRFGRGAKGADALARSIVAAAQLTRGHWVACSDATCFGGAPVPPGEHVNYTCGGCGKSQTAINFVVDIQANREQVRDLITHLAPGGRMRECPNCGTAQTHIGGCAIMNCGMCATNFHLNDGLTTRVHDGVGMRGQSYVPRNGMLLRAGLYEGLEPGSAGYDPATLLRHVTAKAVAKGWLDASAQGS